MIPKSIISQKTIKNLERARVQVMKRTYQTDAKNKMVSYWTFNKMIVKAKEEMRLEIEN